MADAIRASMDDIEARNAAEMHDLEQGLIKMEEARDDVRHIAMVCG